MPPMVRATFPHSVRVTLQRDFERARKSGRSVSDEVLRISFVPNGSGVTRLGLAVPKRGSAIERNRIKRVIREVFRVRRAGLPAGLDLVVSPRSYELAGDFDTAGRSFDALLARVRTGAK
jgi:ribonuclease P protein component